MNTDNCSFCSLPSENIVACSLFLLFMMSVSVCKTVHYPSPVILFCEHWLGLEALWGTKVGEWEWGRKVRCSTYNGAV